MRFRDLDENGAAQYMLQTPRSADEGLGVFVTPNIQHIALARKDDEFNRALASAQIIVADGFPVYRFAKLRGLSLPGRVAGRAVIERMFADPAALAGHRGFFVVDSRATAEGIECWLNDFAPAFAVETLVPPFGFEKDAAYCRSLADAISTFDATLIFLCIGAPKSELFAYRYRALLPPAWALCVGQSFRLLLGMNAPHPT
ncbi:WecB/TagA/CpsF family glycosyltransferase [Sphingomonas melonis]|uniref:WecB/TagA/CpsF family glycosyltransferase n=1 Tax=Sphingomonas melonis TaxID=152682 RepID=UPI001EFF8EEA|nr:WecB/TagA/CpsF family glycosyltransferase [Sphingomonas melonis]